MLSALIKHTKGKTEKKRKRNKRKNGKKERMQWQTQIRVLNSITTKMYAKKQAKVHE